VIRSTGTRAHINHLAEIDLVVEGGYLVAGGRGEEEGADRMMMMMMGYYYH